MRNAIRVLPFVILTICSHAADFKWNDGATGNWNDKKNWTPAKVPGPEDSAEIDHGIVTISSPVAVSSLIVRAGLDRGTVLTVNSRLIVGTLQLGALVPGGGDRIDGSGDVTILKSLNWFSGEFSVVGNLEAGPRSAAVIAGPSSKPLVGTLALRGTAILGGQITLANGTLNPQDGADIEVKDDLIIDSAGNLDSFLNEGAVRKSAGQGIAEILAPFINLGTVKVGAGTLKIPNYTQRSGATELDTGTFFGTIVLNGGTLRGNGTVDGSVENNGVVAPGTKTSAGHITIVSDYTQSFTGTLRLQIGGASVGSYDTVNVGKEANISGTLEFAPLATFAIQPTDRFVVLNAGTLTGTFANINQPPALNFVALYSSNNLTIAKGNLSNYPPSIVKMKVLVDEIISGVPVSFSAIAFDPEGDPLSYSWSFGDDLSGQGNPTTHTYTIFNDQRLAVTLFVSDGLNTVATSMFVNALAVRSGGSGQNISQGIASTNPVSRLSIKVLESNAGVVRLEIDPGPGFSEEAEITTEFRGIRGRVAVKSGRYPVARFDQPGLYIAKATAFENNSKAMGRKTLIVGSREVGLAAAPAGILRVIPREGSSSAEIQFPKMTGKFLFNESVPDKVTFTGKFVLPAGYDTKAVQMFSMGLGNVSDEMNVDEKGKGIFPSTLGRVTKLKIVYPRIKGTSIATGTEKPARISITMNTADMDDLGFDTEGVDPEAPDVANRSAADRDIQVGMVLGGNAYQATAPVSFTVTSDGDLGQLRGRR